MEQPWGVHSHLMSNIRSGVTDVAAHLAHDANMFIAVQQRVLVLLAAGLGAVGCAVGFQAGIGQDHNQSLGIFITGCNGHMLFGDQARQFGRGEGLCSCGESVRGLFKSKSSLGPEMALNVLERFLFVEEGVSAMVIVLLVVVVVVEIGSGGKEREEYWPGIKSS